jgi:hypothetical protein
LDNEYYSSVGGVLFNKSKTMLIGYPGGRTGSYSVPNSVTSVGPWAFQGARLYSLTIPNSVTIIGDGAFSDCSLTTASVTIPNSVASIGSGAFGNFQSLRRVFFQGNAPSADATVFQGDLATAYYLPGTMGWGSSFGGIPTALWTLPYPIVLSSSPSFGIQTNRFGFTVSWATNRSVVVEASVDLANSIWTPVQTNALVNGSFYFSDPQWTNYPGRFYRLRSQ